MPKRKLVTFAMFLGALQLFCGIYFVFEEYDQDISKQGYKQIAETKYFFDNETYVDKTQQSISLSATCKQLGYMEDVVTTTIRAHITPDLNVLYCRVNKCASTMTLELLRQLYDCDTECLLKVSEHVRSNTNAREIMNEAFSFMIVREPYGRLFSTYCNIFYFPKEDWLYRGTKLIKLTRSNISYDSVTYGHDLTFTELIKYTVESYELGNHLDEHVRPMHHKSCNPCVFKFDYIAHLETLSSDFGTIFDQLHDTQLSQKYNKDMLSSLKTWTVMGPVKHLFRTISLLKGSNVSLYNIYLRAWCYYQITGNVLKSIKFPYERRDVFYIKEEDFVKALKHAMYASKNYYQRLKEQKHEALLQAYSTISNDYMERLSKFVFGDCLLFGYENKPLHLFDMSKSLNDSFEFNYFKGL